MGFQGEGYAVVGKTPGIRTPWGFVAFGRDFAADPYGSLERLQEKFGDVVEISSGVGTRIVMLLGPEANQFVLSEGKQLFRFHEAYRSLIPVDGQTALIVSDGQEHARRRRLVQPAFRPRSIDGYLEIMLAEANQAIDGMPHGVKFDAHENLRSAIRRTVIRSLFGEKLADRADEVGMILEPALEFVNLPPQRQIRVNVSGGKYHAAIRARALTDQLIDAEIDRRANMPASSRPCNDVLSMLLPSSGVQSHSGSIRGRSTTSGVTALGPATGYLTRPEIRDQIVSLIAAGYDTTSAALSWAVVELLADDQHTKALRAEIDGVLGDRDLEVQDLPRLVYLDGFILEVLRLHPPGVVIPRYAIENFEFDGYTIKQGSLVMYSPYLSQRDPRTWADPDQLLPLRWDSGRPDFVRPSAHDFVTFGGGARRCIGFGFAMMELKAFLVQIVRRLDVSADAVVGSRATGIATVKPVGGVQVKVRPRRT